MTTTISTPPLHRLVRILRRYYAPLGTVCIVTGAMINTAQGFKSAFELSALDGTRGFTITELGVDRAGRHVSAAGDINGDGIADAVISGDASRGWVVFGRSDSSFATELSSLNGNNGFIFQGTPSDRAGYAASGAGDVNGDGVDDLMIGAPFADRPDATDAGRVYLVFGRSQGFTATIELSALDGSNGFAINSISSGDRLGFTVAGAGDINADGLDDLILGAPLADTAGNNSGQSYVVFGQPQFAAELALSALNGINGFVLNGSNAYDYAGYSVSGAGDINGDDIDDLIIGVFNASASNANSGRSYVIFGHSGVFTATLELSALDGTDGFVLNGENTGDRSGNSVSGVGDVNDDNVDDLIIGASRAGEGKSYVVFGSTQEFTPSLELSALNGANGFVLNGAVLDSGAGSSVNGAGDINGDDIGDLIIGAPLADPFIPSQVGNAGKSYVVLGTNQGFVSSLDLATLDGNNGFVINGQGNNDLSGSSVSGAGDINDDGIDDLIIGVPGADVNGNQSGQSYLIFGTTQGFPPSLNITTGFALNGTEPSDGLGNSVSGAGDINNDGIDDLIISATGASPNGDFSGQSHVIFGRSQGFTARLVPSSLANHHGFVINGIDANDTSGNAVSGAGDINGDGIADVIIGAQDADPADPDRTGQSYVVFGRDQGFTNTLELSELDGNNGFAIDGINVGDQVGHALSAIGDINDDGIDDVVISAFAADANGNPNAGQCYVVFGRSHGFTSTLDLTTLDGANGFVINGINTDDRLGRSVSGAGDVNGDNITDLIIGAPYADINGDNSGQSYLIFGSNQAFSATLELTALDGSNGFVINGENEEDRSGRAVNGASDINGDAIDDFIIGAPRADPNSNSSAGRSYVVFGHSQGFSSTLELSSLDGSNGFIINGMDALEESGRALSGVGDINGDGIDDVIIAAPEANHNAVRVGCSYVLFGRSQGFGDTLELSALDGRNGFLLNGVDSFDRSGNSLSAAGDVNADGVNDLVIGGSTISPNNLGFNNAHVVFGTRADLMLNMTGPAEPVDINTQVDYTVSVTNQGPTYTSDVEVEAIYSAALIFTDYSQNWNCNDLGLITCTLPTDLLANTSETLVLSFITTDQAAQATLTINVSSSDFDPEPNNSTVAETVTIEMLPNEIFEDDFE